MKAVLHAVSEFVLWAMGRRSRYRVTGHSMEPTLYPGEFVLATSRSPGEVLEINSGDLVVGRHPADQQILIIKRIGRRTAEGSFTLASDNPAQGTDSRQWGAVKRDLILGRVTLVLNRPRGPYR